MLTTKKLLFWIVSIVISIYILTHYQHLFISKWNYNFIYIKCPVDWKRFYSKECIDTFKETYSIEKNWSIKSNGWELKNAQFLKIFLYNVKTKKIKNISIWDLENFKINPNLESPEWYKVSTNFQDYKAGPWSYYIFSYNLISPKGVSLPTSIPSWKNTGFMIWYTQEELERADNFDFIGWVEE